MQSTQDQSHNLSYTILNWILLISCSLIWGCSYFLIKKGLVAFQPLEIVSIRIVSAGIVLLPFLFVALRKIPRKKMPFIFLCSILGFGLPIYIYPLAQTHISSSVAGIINSLTPLCTYAIGILYFGMVNKKLKLVGVLLGLAGVLFLILFKPTAEIKADMIYVLIALSAPLLYGINNNIIKKHLTGLPSFPLTSIIFALLLIPSIPMFFLLGVAGKIEVNEASQEALVYVILLGVFGTAIAMSLINILIRRTDIMFAASVTYLMPVVAVLLGALDNEAIGWNELVGLGLILLGVVLINRVK